MQVRFMDWSSDLDRVQRHSGAAKAPSSAAQQPEWLCSIPQAQDSASFDVILGSDILYEVSTTLVCLLVFSAGSKRSAAPLSCAAISGSCMSWMQPTLLIGVRGLKGSWRHLAVCAGAACAHGGCCVPAEAEARRDCT